jgi:(1->4)-alpha-D-glucan 1-alpha-D-glucosylmutase
MALPPPRRLPISSYRLQLNPSFTFADATALVPYLADLGITECYCSPILAARPGSTHGYDLCDYGQLNTDLGGTTGFAAFVNALRDHGLGLVVDFVPNHMSADPSVNVWWRSVLENGPSSPFAHYFDIDWDPAKAELRGKILLPILGDQYGVALETGALQLEFEGGVARLRYGQTDLPLNPRQLGRLLEYRLEALREAMPVDDPDLMELQSILFHLERLPPYTDIDPHLVAERQREKEVAQGRLLTLLERAPTIRAHLERNVAAFNGTAGNSASFDRLHELLEAQPYRLASWRTAGHEINYRRFFDVNELAGIRMEVPAVFEAAHELIGRLIRDGAVTGIRLDHIDGLFDPPQYLEDLARLAAPGDSIWTLVEKILSPGERIDDTWSAHGTTGYEVLNALNALYVDPTRARAFRTVYARFTGHRERFDDVVYASKELISTTSMASELNVLARALNRISESHRRFRDFTLDSLQEALREMIACFPVYRTYVRREGWSPWDEATVDRAIGDALHRNPALEPTIFQFIRRMLLPEAVSNLAPDDRERQIAFAMKFQQYTSPVQAKGVEDTAFYRYFPLLSINEVGGDPTRFGISVAEFHAANQDRLRYRPFTMVTTTTHDTKRSEDVRARLNALSEMPERWRGMLGQWARTNASARSLVQGRPAPDRADEYHLYQVLLGAWPSDSAGTPDEDFAGRIREYMLKAMREAKVHTSWMNQADDYERAVLRFVDRILTAPKYEAFRRTFESFAREIAWYGMLNALSQLALKLTVPGVPDFYQGTELWTLTLVDPDNRRPVDFRRRAEVLAECRALQEAPTSADARRLFDRWQDGRIKLYVTLAGLQLRRRQPDLFLAGEYVPLDPAGERADHVVAFLRWRGDEIVLVVVPRLVTAWSADGPDIPVGPAQWGDTNLPVPAAIAGRRFTNVLTGECIRMDDRTPVSTLLATLPVGLFLATAR